MIISGTVEPGFESVRDLYESKMSTLAERNTQLCVYVEDQCVVDLWGSAIDDADFGPDALINVFSSGKSLESITLAMLQDRGLFSYDDRIADYWPEYAALGKAQTTIADLMRHEAGLAAFDTTLGPLDLQPARLKQNAVGQVIERQQPKYREGNDNQREYHAITRGWIANELFRRLEPGNRTMGEFLREEVAAPLGVDVHIGLSDEELSRLSDVEMLGFGYQFGQSLIPKRLGRKIELNLAQSIAKFARLRGTVKNRTTAGAPTPIQGMQKISVFNSPLIAQAEIPSAGAKCSARGLAKLAAVMANGGALQGQTLLSDEAWHGLHDKPVERSMMAMRNTFTQGGVAAFSSEASLTPLEQGLNVGREGFIGWMGLGGSVFQWNPDKRIGFAYIPTSLNVLDLVNERAKNYQAQVLKCVA